MELPPVQLYTPRTAFVHKPRTTSSSAVSSRSSPESHGKLCGLFGLGLASTSLRVAFCALTNANHLPEGNTPYIEKRPSNCSQRKRQHGQDARIEAIIFFE